MRFRIRKTNFGTQVRPWWRGRLSDWEVGFDSSAREPTVNIPSEFHVKSGDKILWGAKISEIRRVQLELSSSPNSLSVEFPDGSPIALKEATNDSARRLWTPLGLLVLITLFHWALGQFSFPKALVSTVAMDLSKVQVQVQALPFHREIGSSQATNPSRSAHPSSGLIQSWGVTPVRNISKAAERTERVPAVDTQLPTWDLSGGEVSEISLSSAQELKRQIRALRPQLQNCFSDALRIDRRLKGSVQIEIAFRDTGNVQSVRIHGLDRKESSGATHDFRKCLEQQHQSLFVQGMKQNLRIQYALVLHSIMP